MRARGATASCVVFASYVVVFGLVAWPWLSVAAHSLPIPSPVGRADARLLTWILWWVGTALVDAPRLVFDAPINYPAARQLAGSDHFAALQIVYLPIYRLTGNPVLAVNSILFLSYPAAAFAMNRLLRALDFGPAVAWVVGLLFAWSALQVPTSLYMLHALAAFPPAAAFALHRLRDEPRPARAAVLALVLLLGFCTSYYTAAILLVVVLVFGAAEIARPLAGRRRFIALATAVLAGSVLVLAALSLPYLARAMPYLGESPQPMTFAGVLASGVSVPSAASVRTFGGITLLLAAAGAVAVLLPHTRWLVLTALALVATGAFLSNGGALAVADALPAEAPRLLRLPARFFRIVPRYALISSLGFALLAATALQLAARRLPRHAATALLAVVALAVTFERGAQIRRQPLEASRALTSDAAIYREVGRLVALQGPGPLLELPIRSKGRSLQPEAMLGAIAHRQPLVTGHTGYPPPHRIQLDEVIRRLPDEHALQAVVDMTHMRWLLLRPQEYWATPASRERFVAALRGTAGVGGTWTISGWTLVAIERAPLRAATFDAIAKGSAAGSGPIAQPTSPSDAQARDAT